MARDPTGCRFKFRIGSISHPDPDQVHEDFCQDLALEGVCEYLIPAAEDGGPYLMIRVAPDKRPVLVAFKDVMLLPPVEPGGHERR